MSCAAAMTNGLGFAKLADLILKRTHKPNEQQKCVQARSTRERKEDIASRKNIKYSFVCVCVSQENRSLRC